MRLLLLLLLSFSLSAQNFDFLNGFNFGDGEGDDDACEQLCFFSNGDLLATGQFEGLIDFDPDSAQSFLATSVQGGGEPYFLRYDSQGNLIWWRALRSKRDIHIYGVQLDAQDNIYLTGTYIEEVIFDASDPNARLSGISPNDGDGYLAKFDPNGGYLWSKRFAGTGIDAGIDIEINPAGEIVVLGHFGDSLQFDPAQSSSLRISAGAGDIFMAAYDANNGNFKWTQSITGIGFDNARALAIDALGNYYINGDYTSTITFSLSPLSTLVSSGGNDVFVAKYDVNRNFKWAEKIAGSSTDLGVDMILIGDTLLAIAGTFRNNVQLDPAGINPVQTGASSLPDIFLTVLDTAAQFRWGHTFGSTSTDQVYDLTYDPAGLLYIGGYFALTVDFDPNPNATQNRNGLGGDGFYAGYQVNNGAFSQVQQIAGPTFTKVNALALAPNQKIWAGGALYGTADFNPSGAPFNLSSPASNNSNSFFAAYSGANFDTAWLTQDREGGNDQAKKSIFLQNGKVLSTGFFSGGVDFDSDTGQTWLNSHGQEDIYLAQYKNDLSLEWAIKLGGIGSDAGMAIAEDPAGNLYLAGEYEGTLYFENLGQSDSLVGQSNLAAFLAKYSPQGNLIWIQNLTGNPGFAYINDLSVNASAQIAVAGLYQGSISFDGTNMTPNASNRAAFLAVYDSAQGLVWSQIVDGSSNEYGLSTLAASNGDFYLGGSYRNTVDFDPGSAVLNRSSSFGTNDIFITKYNSSGAFQWVRTYGQRSFEGARDISEDSQGNLYITGEFEGTVDFNPPQLDTLSSAGATDAFVLKLDPNGSFIWAKQLGGSNNDIGYGLQVKNGQVFHAGSFYNTIDLNPNADTLFATAAARRDIYLQVLDTAGNFVQGLSFGNLADDEAFAVDHLNGQTLLSGYFGNTVDFNPQPNQEQILRSFGDQDGFLVKLGNAGPCPTAYDTIHVQACGSYTWFGRVLNQSAWYQEQLFTQAGCDSIISLDLQISPHFDSLQSISACNSYPWRGTVYHQSGVYYDSLQSQAGCDSIYQLDLNLNFSFTDTLAISACDNYTWRGTTYNQSGVYYDSLQSQASCDSIYQLDLNLSSTFTDTLAISACDNYTWRGTTYNQSGLYYDSLVSAFAGCDSIYILDLIINTSYYQTLSLQSCDSLVLAGNTYYSSGQYFDTLQSTSGCDSILELNLQIDSLDLNVATNGFNAAAQQTNAQYQWINCDNGAIIPGATQAIFDPVNYNAPNASYAVIISQGNCSDTSACIFLQNIGLEEMLSSHLNLYPNPSDGKVYLEWPHAGTYKLELYDAAGALIRAWPVLENSTTYEFELPQAAGSYFLRIQNAAGDHWQKTVIRH